MEVAHLIFGHMLVAVVTRRKLAYALLIALLLVIAVKERSGSDVARSPSRTDSWGDPFVTGTQVAAIRIGMSTGEVIRVLDGEGSTGFYTNGPRGSDSVPGPKGLILLFEYPLRPAGNAASNPAGDQMISWWRICVQRGRVVGERRVEHVDRTVGCWG